LSRSANGARHRHKDLHRSLEDYADDQEEDDSHAELENRRPERPSDE